MTGFSADNMIGVGGIHACVVKSEHGRIGRLAGWAGSIDNVIFKSDTYAPCGNLSVDQVDALRYPPNTTPWFTPAVTTSGFLLNPTAAFTGPIHVSKARVDGVTTGLGVTDSGNTVYIASLDMSNCTYGYNIADTARALIGKEHLTAVGTKFQVNPPSLAATWANFGGVTSTWDVALSNYGVELKGYLVSSGTALLVMNTLPLYLRPAEARRYPALFVTGGVSKYGTVTSGADGWLGVNETLPAPIAGDQVSLDGIGWSL